MYSVDETQQNWYNSVDFTNSKEDKKCECGCHKTYGKECPIEFHKDYCPLSPNYKHPKEQTITPII